ncbi:glycosyltransferase family 61 protein [Sunxiuqinia sp. A32]|uniref:glycosyltransferase family 61 protein n=1 Tax=Sunxiuqinia sp. A32 TaxID=3461496 RepID=UPI004045FFB1
MKLKDIKWKIEVFTKKVLYHQVYYNYKLRPKGCYLNIKEYISKNPTAEEIYQEIYPEMNSEIQITDVMLKDLSSYITYPLLEKEPAKYILKIKNGRILTDSLWTISIFDDMDKIIGGVSLDLLLKENQSIKDSRVFKRKYFHKVKHFKGTVFHTIAGGGSYINYAHWLVDSFSKLHILKESGFMEKIDWFYVPTIKYDYQLDSLIAFGVPKEKIIDSTYYPHIKADMLIASSYSRGSHHIPYWIVEFLRNEFPPKNKPAFSSRKFFISRKDSSFRNIVNEDEVATLLLGYGIITVVLSELSFQEKIDLFAYADLIISLSGAGLTNFVFCEENTTVMELFGDQYVDFTFFYDIASKRNLDYHYFIGRNMGKINKSVKGQSDDVYIDCKLLKEKIEEELNLSNLVV